MRSWISALVQAQQRKEIAVVITVAGTKGSVPREAGTRMIVTTNDVAGTIGGGHLEFRAIDIAKGMIAANGPRALHRFPLGATLGQCCGGVVTLLFEPIPRDAAWLGALTTRASAGKTCVIVTPVSGDARAGKLILDVESDRCFVAEGSLGCSQHDAEAGKVAWSMLTATHPAMLKTMPASALKPEQTYFFDLLRSIDFHIVLFGAGHVGRALVTVLSALPCNVTWVDSRDDAFPSVVPANVRPMATDLPEGEVDIAMPGSYFLVMTHSHALDQILTERILRRNDFAYFGLIGSQSKRSQFERRLLGRGFSNAQCARMNCPIGALGITGKEPATIAIAVAAEMLQRRSKHRCGVHPANLAVSSIAS